MNEAIKDSEPDAAPLSKSAAKRPGQKALYVWLPIELIDRVHKCRRAEKRTLTAFVERALEQSVDMGQRYAALAGPDRARRRGQGRG